MLICPSSKVGMLDGQCNTYIDQAYGAGHINSAMEKVDTIRNTTDWGKVSELLAARGAHGDVSKDSSVNTEKSPAQFESAASRADRFINWAGAQIDLRTTQKPAEVPLPAENISRTMPVPSASFKLPEHETSPSLNVSRAAGAALDGVARSAAAFMTRQRGENDRTAVLSSMMRASGQVLEGKGHPEMAGGISEAVKQAAQQGYTSKASTEFRAFMETNCPQSRAVFSRLDEALSHGHGNSPAPDLTSGKTMTGAMVGAGEDLAKSRQDAVDLNRKMAMLRVRQAHRAAQRRISGLARPDMGVSTERGMRKEDGERGESMRMRGF